jgi:REP element-mobilizing transposase RayT
MTLYENKYRIETARLPAWNYAADGSYFLTICTHRSECILGEIVSGEMKMSDLGVIVHEELLRSFEIRHEITYPSFVIMPNHLHLIVNLVQLEKCKHYIVNTSRLQPKSISSFVGGFKSAVTTRMNTFRNTAGKKVWHPRFYDHLIRNNHEFEYIFNYIIHNPATWDKDRFNGNSNPDDESANYPEN